jgi:hypothetical protein
VKGDMSKFELIEDCTAQRTAIVVLGAGGSAASAVGDVLARLGCDAPASEGDGTSKIADLNNAVLQSSGTVPNDWAGFNRSWLSSPKATEFLKRALELLKTELGATYLAVMQEPSTAQLLPFWSVVFDRAGIVPRYLCIVSDPTEVAEYLLQHFEIEHGTGHLIWLRATLEAEANSRGSMRAFAHTEQLSQDPVTSMMSVAKSLKLTFPRDVKTTFASRNFRLKQYRERIRCGNTESSRSSEAVTADWVTATHQTLKAWTFSGETAEGRRVLDTVREAFDEAVPAFLGVSQSAARSDWQGAFLNKSDLCEGDTPSGRDLQRVNEEQAQALEDAQEELRARYSEIVTLTRMLADETAAAQRYERNAKKLGGMALAFERGAVRGDPVRWFDWIVPWRWRQRQIKRIIEREGLFDSKAYLAANMDVKNAGADPLRHYISHGAMEGRPLGCE